VSRLQLPHLRCVLLAACGLLSTLSCLADDTSRAFLWEQANTQAAAAVKPDDYIKAANTYNRLVLDGARNGALFLNLGSTLVLAGDGANAAAAYARAERYLGATPETRQGLAAAAALQLGRARADPPWSRAAFFWHFALPCETRVWAALFGWALLWLGVLCRILFRARSPHSATRSLSDTCLLTGGLIGVLFGASALATLSQERHDSATWGSRVFLSTTPPDREGEP
jgi:hypothetical protein